MSVSVVMNGAIQNTGPDGRIQVTIDVTVGGVHHQVRFLKDDLLKYPVPADLQKYIAQQCKSVDTAAAGVTGLPAGLADLRGTVSV